MSYDANYCRFLTALSPFLTYECGCSYSTVHGHSVCFGSNKLEYTPPPVETVPLQSKNHSHRPAIKTRPTPYTVQDIKLGVWYDKYLKSGYLIDPEQNYVWINTDCQNCRAASLSSSHTRFISQKSADFENGLNLLNATIDDYLSGDAVAMINDPDLAIALYKGKITSLTLDEYPKFKNAVQLRRERAAYLRKSARDEEDYDQMEVTSHATEVA